MVIFHSYVKLPEGIQPDPVGFFEVCLKMRCAKEKSHFYGKWGSTLEFWGTLFSYKAINIWLRSVYIYIYTLGGLAKFPNGDLELDFKQQKPEIKKNN